MTERLIAEAVRKAYMASAFGALSVKPCSAENRPFVESGTIAQGDTQPRLHLSW